MAENSKIAWTDHTFNPWIWCSRVSPGCQNCYAENLMATRYKRVECGPGKPRSRTKTWNDPIKWNRAAEREGIRTKVFCASLADWLDEEVPCQWREDLFDLIEVCHHLDWLMLTKRPQCAKIMLPLGWLAIPPKQIWFGVTAENQQYWDSRVSLLRDIPAATHWVSYEPSLGPLVIDQDDSKCVDWLIIGGESEQNFEARPFEIEWAESVISQCRTFDIVPFMKQVGQSATYHGKHFKTLNKAGADPAEWPESIRVREFPGMPSFTSERSNS